MLVPTFHPPCPDVCQLCNFFHMVKVIQSCTYNAPNIELYILKNLMLPTFPPDLPSSDLLIGWLV